jgi:hypothetical protein
MNQGGTKYAGAIAEFAPIKGRFDKVSERQEILLKSDYLGLGGVPHSTHSHLPVLLKHSILQF